MPRLLIIDDDEALRKLLRSRLEDCHDITDTSDPEEGIALALQKKPDAILLDLMMPRYSGFEICQTLSSLSFTQRIPIFIVSGESTSRYKDFCLNLGAKGFFQKPVDFVSLRKALADAIDGGHSAPRSEARVRIKAALKLRGRDRSGAHFDQVTSTDNVTANSFQCGCHADLVEGTVVDVYRETSGLQFSGKARLVRVDWPGTPRQTCAFEFVEKPADWVL